MTHCRVLCVAILAIALFAASCSDATAPERCRRDASIELGEGSCLEFDDDDQLRDRRALIEQIVRETFDVVSPLIGVADVAIEIGTDAASIIPEIGLGGRANGTDVVRIAIDPLHPSLDASLNTALLPLLAHELHHIARHREYGFSSNLFEAMVLEGLADHFSIEVAGIDPPIWALALRPSELDNWIGQADAVWLNAGYDHDKWFFGSNPPPPRWAGYSIGFELVRRYLMDHPSARPSTLTGEPSSSFAPARPELRVF
jgi:hypothetical protein